MVAGQSLCDTHRFIHKHWLRLRLRFGSVASRLAPPRRGARLNPIPSELLTVRRGQAPT